ncbi:hypothetical protein H4219_003707 [Mycoemilia scoparia]|uniref:F-box domain-containing protein n=1 Tax=Mycoemilia scoparia TaxID=417184 RepID=A0A9W7ZU02_9FUNG|nr:hypothetical protein H4219_003707 [Mycoemilia scoparia]
MLPYNLSSKIYTYLLTPEGYDTLGQLQKVSKGWHDTVLHMQWTLYMLPDHRTTLYYSQDSLDEKHLERSLAGKPTPYEMFLYFGYKYVAHLCFRYPGLDDYTSFSIVYPKLTSLSVEALPKYLEKVPCFIRLNTTLRNLMISNPTTYEHERVNNLEDIKINEQFLRKALCAPVSNQLVHLDLSPATHIPCISFILDKLPRLESLILATCIIDDLSDIFVNPDSLSSCPKLSDNDTPRPHGPYKHLLKLTLNRWYTPYTENTTNAHDLVLNTKLFPNLSCLNIESPLDKLLTPELTNTLVQIPLKSFFAAPLNRLTKLTINDIDHDVAHLIDKNCPSLNFLKMNCNVKSSSLSNYHRSFSALAGLLPKVTEFNIGLWYVSLDPFSPDIFFYQVDIQERSEIEIYYQYMQFRQQELQNQRLGASAMTTPMSSHMPEINTNTSPIKVNWSSLKRLTLNSTSGYTPCVFRVLGKFKNLEFLSITIRSLDGVQELINFAAGAINSLFPKLTILIIKFDPSFVFDFPKALYLFALFPGLRHVVLLRLKNRPLWVNVFEAFPNIQFVIR